MKPKSSELVERAGELDSLTILQQTQPLQLSPQQKLDTSYKPALGPPRRSGPSDLPAPPAPLGKSEKKAAAE